MANWDSPQIDVLPYVVVGNQYAVSLATRFDPANSPTSSSTIALNVAAQCTDLRVPVTFNVLQQLDISPNGDWTRMSGKFQASMDNCSQLSNLYVYVSTNETNVPYASIDVDDFQLWDVTPATGN